MPTPCSFCIITLPSLSVSTSRSKTVAPNPAMSAFQPTERRKRHTAASEDASHKMYTLFPSHWLKCSLWSMLAQGDWEIKFLAGWLWAKLKIRSSLTVGGGCIFVSSKSLYSKWDSPLTPKWQSSAKLLPREALPGFRSHNEESHRLHLSNVPGTTVEKIPNSSLYRYGNCGPVSGNRPET